MVSNLMMLAKQANNKGNVRRMAEKDKFPENSEIAVIGMAGSIGDANDLEDFFQKVLHDYDFVTELPENRKRNADAVYKALYPDSDVSKIRYVKGGYMPSIDLFDYEFFGIPFIEAATMDPVQRAIFETTIKALWDAGYTEKQMDNTATGVFVGNSNTSAESYKQYVVKCDESLKNVALAGNLNAVLSSRISYYLNLKGSSMVIDTACSSGLVALHLACEELKKGDCNLAIVAGAKINLIPPIMQEGNLAICSDDGYTRTFDASSQGTGIGEGVVSLILKPLQKAKEDRDNIYAVIKGSALNQDGKSVGITAPNAQSQVDLLMDVWRKSNVDPENIQYIEAHGTATKLGDVVEIEAITKAFQQYTRKKQFCAIASVKSNVGHTDVISGLVGLVKCIYAMNEKKIPASLHFESPNSKINFIESPVYVNDKCRDWNVDPNEKRICCVNSFGLSGTNVCVVLQEYTEPGSLETSVEEQTVCISAKSIQMLIKLVKMYHSFVKGRPDLNLEDFVYTVNKRRSCYKYKVNVSFSKYEELLSGLHELSKDLENGSAVVSESSEWDDTVSPDGVKCISVPSHPLDKKRCFVTMKCGERTNSHSKNDLIPSLLINTIKENVYEIEISTYNQWELGEHNVNDKYLLVGTSYLEIVTQIARIHYGISNAHIYEMILLNGLNAADDEKIRFQIYVQRENEAFHFEMYSNQNGMCICHCRGYFDDAEPKPADRYNVNDILGKINTDMTITPEIYLYGQIKISDRWHVTTKIYIGNEYYTAKIKIPEKYQNEAEEYILYPTLMDSALNFSNTIQGEGTYLPWQYGNLEIYDRIPNDIYSFIEVSKNNASKEILKFNVSIVTEDGKVVAAIHDYVVKRVNLSKETTDKDLCFSSRKWVQVEDNEYTIGEKQKSLILNWTNNKAPLDINEYQRVIYDCSISEEYDNFDAMYSNVYLNFISFMKELLSVRPEKLKEIVIINNNGYSVKSEPILNYYGAALAAGLKSLKFEYPNYVFRYIDYDESEKEDLLNLLDIDSNIISLAIRNGKYYKEEISIDDKREASDIKIQKDGIYVITGGLGGVGLTIADAMSEAGAGKIVLLGRKDYPNLKAAGNELYSDFVNKEELFQKIQHRGTQIEYISVDVTDKKAVYDVLEMVSEKYGMIRGIVHAAGIAGEGLFFKKDMEELQKVLNIKIKGLHNLEAFVEEKQITLDFMMLCSSFTALAGAVGQWDYAVANEFLNVYCNLKKNNGGCKYISAVWPTWEESGMAHKRGFKRDECLLLPISNETGKKYFTKLIASEYTESVLGIWNKELLASKNVKLNISFHSEKKKTIDTASANKRKSTGNDINIRTIKAELHKLWRRVLGRDDINEDDKFFEIEGNSILATYLLSEINQVYGNILDITDIFTYSSINSMADIIYKKVSKKKKRMVTEKDDLDELLQSLVNGEVTVEDITSKI